MDLSVLPSEEDMPLSASLYRLRRPQDSDYYRCVEDYFESFVQVYDEIISHCSMASGGPMSSKRSIAILIAVTSTMDLHVSNARTVAPNIYWPFLASAATSALRVIRSAWWNSGNGCVWMSSRRFPTGISYRVPSRAL
jgi:hypothetical protein